MESLSEYLKKTMHDHLNVTVYHDPEAVGLDSPAYKKAQIFIKQLPTYTPIPEIDIRGKDLIVLIWKSKRNEIRVFITPRNISYYDESYIIRALYTPADTNKLMEIIND